MEDRIRRREHAARQRPRGAPARRGERAQADPRRNRELETGRGFQSARAVPRRSRLRSERRELYVGILGNERLRVFPIWELEFGSMPQGARLIATEKVKHDLEYQQRHDIVVGPAKDLSPQLVDSIKRAAKRIYRTLDLDGYARIDFRLSADGIPYYIEANPNAEIARNEEFASAAKHDGLEYPELIQRILGLGISRAGAVGIEQEKGA